MVKHTCLVCCTAASLHVKLVGVPRHKPTWVTSFICRSSLTNMMLNEVFFEKMLSALYLQTTRVDKPTERGHREAEKTSSQEETSILQQLPSTNHKL